MKVDTVLLRMRFEEDAEYTSTSECYLDKKTGKVFWQHIDVDECEFEFRPAVANDWREQNILLNTYPDRFVFVPAISHGEWHQVFSEWHKEMFGSVNAIPSIGGTLTELDENGRQSWFNFKYDYTERRVDEFVNAVETDNE